MQTPMRDTTTQIEVVAESTTNTNDPDSTKSNVRIGRRHSIQLASGVVHPIQEGIDEAFAEIPGHGKRVFRRSSTLRGVVHAWKGWTPMLPGLSRAGASLKVYNVTSEDIATTETSATPYEEMMVHFQIRQLQRTPSGTTGHPDDKRQRNENTKSDSATQPSVNETQEQQLHLQLRLSSLKASDLGSSSHDDSTIPNIPIADAFNRENVSPNGAPSRMPLARQLSHTQNETKAFDSFRDVCLDVVDSICDTIQSWKESIVQPISPFSTFFTSALRFLFCWLQGEGVATESAGQNLFASLSVLVGSIVLAVVFGHVAILVANFNANFTGYQRKIEAVFAMTAKLQLPESLRGRIHEYYEHLWHEYECLNGEIVQFSKELSHTLGLEVVLFKYMELVMQVPFWKDCTPDFQKQLVLRLDVRVYLPNDFITREGEVDDEFYMVNRGYCELSRALHRFKRITNTLLMQRRTSGPGMNTSRSQGGMIGRGSLSRTNGGTTSRRRYPGLNVVNFNGGVRQSAYELDPAQRRYYSSTGRPSRKSSPTPILRQNAPNTIQRTISDEKNTHTKETTGSMNALDCMTPTSTAMHQSQATTQPAQRELDNRPVLSWQTRLQQVEEREVTILRAPQDLQASFKQLEARQSTSQVSTLSGAACASSPSGTVVQAPPVPEIALG
ncbi:unnamed protein product [Phytophthora lilii]|uniref:Unnamed protein product n=1 Tax=Phytophthora lilii TaxID=2077276 RepID=A0A9W6TN57_9STRA|nr:unnamed protein product [Phytophthora lilii]